MAEFVDYYQVLKVSREATDAEVRRSYRELAKGCHPDSNPSPEAHEAFLALGRAYKVLGDQNRRKQYNYRYDRHHGLATKSTNNGPTSLERVRAKRATRYQRGRSYSSRVRYRGTASKPGESQSRPRRKGADPAAEAQREIYKRYAEAALAREEGKIKGFKGFGRVMQLCCVVILGICLFMVVDKGFPVPKAPEAVVKVTEIPWSIDRPGLSRVFTSRRSVAIPRAAAEEFIPGLQVRMATTLFSNIPLKVSYQKYGRTFQIQANSPVYGSFFILIWGLIAMCVATIIFRQNAEFNAYLGMITVILAVIVAGIVLRSF